MLMTAGDKDSLNVTASCPHAARFSCLSDFSLHKTDVPHELASFWVSATTKALRNVCIRTLSTLMPALPPMPLLNTESYLFVLWRWCCRSPLELV